MSADEGQGEPTSSEAPGGSVALKEAVADKRPVEVQERRNTESATNSNTDDQDKKKQGAINWEVRPPASSPEFASYFENVVKTSKTRGEAMSRLGYSTAGVIYYHLERLGIPRPLEWSRRPAVKLHQQKLVPEVIIIDPVAREWVGALIQGEGCIQSRYVRKSQSTCLEVDVSLIDPAPIRKLSGYYGLLVPSKPIPNHEWTPLWRKSVFGLRALRILQEILPILTGEKRREAEKAIAFFSPDGYHPGRFNNAAIWPRNEFPLRSKRRGGPSGTNIQE
jgi:hypothetical protein